MKSNRYILFLVLLIVVSCTTPQNTVPPQPTSTIISNTSTLPPSPIETNTETPIPHDISHECVSLSETKLTGTGYFLVEKTDTASTWIYNMKSMTLEEKVKKFVNMKADSKGEALSYVTWTNGGSDWFFTVEKQGKIFQTPLKEASYSTGWVNDHTLILENDPFLYTVFVDPYTEEKIRLDTNFPDMWMYPNEVSHYWFKTIPVFDPSLEYAVYPIYIPDSYNTINFIQVKDMTSLGRFQATINDYPEWSPTGESFAIFSFFDNKRELIRVFKDGKVNVLTDLYSKYLDYWFYYYRWSPDGQRIAAWFSEGRPSGDEYLAIIDLEHNTTTVSCIISGAVFNFPQWSPDGNQFVVRMYSERDQAIQFIVVDVEKMSYSVLDSTEDTIPVPMGWLTFKPDRK